MQYHRFPNRVGAISIFVVLVSVLAGDVGAQNQKERQDRKQLREAPLGQIENVARAQAELLEAEGQKKLLEAKSVAELSKIGNEFSQKLLEVEVDMAVFRWYWKKKSERKQEDRKAVEQEIENRQLYEIQRRAKLMAQYDSIFKPERMQLAKLKGTPQNLMLALLNERTEIAYSSGLPSGMELKDPTEFALTQEVIDSIRVSSPTISGRRMTASLANPVAIDLSWWPTLLMHEDFATQRRQVEMVREQLADSVKKGTKLEASVSDELEESLSLLASAFYRKYPPGDRQGYTNRQYLLIFQSEDFLRRLDQEVSAVVLNGSASLVQGKSFDLQMDAQNIGTLVRWMLINNLRFEPPHPADAAQYAILFERMKAFCIACDLSVDMDWVQEASKNLDLEVE